jgi:hypothetical protein
MLDDLTLAWSLDDEWRSPQAVKRITGTPGKLLHLVQTLDRLAAAGLADVKVTEIKHRCRRAVGGQGTLFQPITVKQYRKRGTL